MTNTTEPTLEWAEWGRLRARYETPRPRRMLALDGGGIRGILTLEVLEKLENDLRARYGGSSEFRLSQFFDYIGGTSTGAIIATALARGMSVKDVKAFYTDFGRQVFRKRPLLDRLRSLYENGPLEQKLREVYGRGGKDTNLKPEDLESLLLVVTRNATTDSAWPISSNPWAKYNRYTRKDCNLQIPLWKLVRASTAAPVYFSPEVIDWDTSDPSKSFVFVDGGTSAYNCPAFLMYRMATEPAYRLGWDRGERNLLIVSVGTGNAPVFGNEPESPDGNVVSGAVNTLLALMSQALVDQDMNCRTVGRCTHGESLDREVGTLVSEESLDKETGRAFLYARYDAELTWSGLKRLGLESKIDAAKVNKLDAVEAISDLQEVGRALAKCVDVGKHFGMFADPSASPLHLRTGTP